MMTGSIPLGPSTSDPPFPNSFWAWMTPGARIRLIIHLRRVHFPVHADPGQPKVIRISLVVPETAAFSSHLESNYSMSPLGTEHAAFAAWSLYQPEHGTSCPMRPPVSQWRLAAKPSSGAQPPTLD